MLRRSLLHARARVPERIAPPRLPRLERRAFAAPPRAAAQPRMPRRPLSENTKKTTGIVGLPVVENAREVLTSLYKRTLDETAARFPADIAYRKYVESFTKYRLSVLERSATIEEFEEEVGMGQIEELIEEAEDELEAMKVYHARRFWEPMPGDTDTTKPRIEFVFSGETEAEIQEALKYAASVNKSRAAAAGAGGAASAAGTVPPAGAAAKP